MPYCIECGADISQDAAYCPQCGASQANTLTSTPVFQPGRASTQRGGGFRKVMKCTGIGCGGLIGLFVLLIIIGLIVSASEDDVSEDDVQEEKPAATVPDPTTRIDATIPPTHTPTAIPTPTPMPTATPTPMPIQVELTELLDEYDQNKVRANTRLRYQQNGQISVSTSGYVDEVEELYVIVIPSQEQYSFQTLYCYYSDTSAALHMTKGQHVSMTGRVRGTDGYTSRVYMFACDFDEIDLDKNPTISVQELRQNVVQVFCISGSVFSSSYTGTGVIVDSEDGIILTVHHVVSDENDCTRIEVALQDIGNRVLATIDKHCASIDRARLHVSPEALSGLSLQPIYRATAPAQIDQEIYFWGYGPDELRMGTGIVMATLREDIVTDAYAVPGDSGSPVFDEYGHLLGTMSRSNRSDRAVFTGDEC